MAIFTISLDTDFEEFWRYNLVAMAQVMRNGEQLEILKHRSEIAPVGAELREPPKGYVAERDVVLRSGDADALVLYIYVIPHTLPRVTHTNDAPPFELRVKVKHGTTNVYSHRHMINQWSGDNIAIDIDAN